MQILTASICSAFNSFTIGTKVVDDEPFLTMLAKALKAYDMPADGHGFVPLNEAIPAVSCGVAKRQDIKPDDCVVRSHRGELELFAQRRFAVPAEALNVIVYTGDAYRSDPQVSAEESQRVAAADFVIVAILASAGPKPPVSSHRFVRNLAGGNSSYSAAKGYTLDKAIADAKAIVAYEQEWITVSD